MADTLSDEQVDRLQRLFDALDDMYEELTPWQQGFISDQRERFEKYGSETRLSVKQWAQIEKIEEVVLK